MEPVLFGGLRLALGLLRSVYCVRSIEMGFSPLPVIHWRAMTSNQPCSRIDYPGSIAFFLAMNWIVLIAGLIVALLVFTFVLKVLRAAVSTAIAIALVVLVVQLIFGIGPGEVFRQVSNLWNSLWSFFLGQ